MQPQAHRHRYLIPLLMLAAFAAQVNCKSVVIEDGLTSCSEERKQAVLSTVPEHAQVIWVRTILDQDYCGYYTHNYAGSSDETVYDDSYMELERKKRSLEPCSTCTIEKSLFNKNGDLLDGPLNETVVTPAEAPGPVTNLQAEFTESGNINVIWQKPGTSCPVDTYKLSYEYTELQRTAIEHQRAEILLNVAMEQKLLDDVASDALYTICVTASSDEGDGPQQCVKIKTPAAAHPVLPPPLSLEAADRTSSSMTVSWLPPAGVAEAAEAKYALSIAEADLEDAPVTKYLLSGNVFSHEVNGLLSGRKYLVTVKAIDKSGTEGRETSLISRTAMKNSSDESSSQQSLKDSKDDESISKNVAEETTSKNYKNNCGYDSEGGYNKSVSQFTNKASIFSKFLTACITLLVLIF